MTATTVRDPLRARAISAIWNRRVTIFEARTDIGRVPYQVIARVDTSQPGSRRYYIVDLQGGRWSCVCDAWKEGNRCAHVAAVQMVCGGATTMGGTQ